MIHWKEFLKFEKQNKLFQLEEDGLYIWDILRFPAYLDYMWDNYQDERQKHRKGELLVRQLRRLWSLIKFIFRRSKPNLFFIHSRDRMPDGRFFDKVTHDFLQRIAGESHILETFEAPGVEYAYPISLFNCAYLFRRLYYQFYRDRDYSELVEKINTQLGLNWDNRRINRYIGFFKGERLFYRWLFRWKKTKRVYVSFDVPKAIYCAAREKGVETVEFQHGIIDKGHIAYNYPQEIVADGRVYCPDMLLTFSDFWCRDIHYPVKQIVPVGNSVLAEMELGGKVFDPASQVIGFISADVFGQSLASLAIEYTKLHPADRILFKLHPNQFSRVKQYSQLFLDYPAIRVVTNEQPTEKVILSCDAVVLIQSTIAYQALQAGIPVFIYKRMTYYRHGHIFHSPNVRLIDNAKQIVLTGKPKPGPGDIYFEDFDERVYQFLYAEQATDH